MLANLESAPVPITRHTEGHLRLRLARRSRACPSHGTRRDGARRHRLGSAMGLLLRCPAAACHAGGGRVAPASPRHELEEAVVAGAGGVATRVEVCALVERHELHRVRVAKDVATAPAVVPSDKVVEVLFAGWVVADIGFSVGLCGRTVLLVSFVMACILIGVV